MTLKEQKDKYIDFVMTVAEEIELTTGMKTKVVNKIIEVDTRLAVVHPIVIGVKLAVDLTVFCKLTRDGIP